MCYYCVIIEKIVSALDYDYTGGLPGLVSVKESPILLIIATVIFILMILSVISLYKINRKFCIKYPRLRFPLHDGLLCNHICFIVQNIHSAALLTPLNGTTYVRFMGLSREVRRHREHLSVKTKTVLILHGHGSNKHKVRYGQHLTSIIHIILFLSIMIMKSKLDGKMGYLTCS